jgi:cobalt/nickel transport protein
MEKRYQKAFLGLMLVFAIALAGYFAFAAMYGDGLEKTMQDNGVSEGQPVYTAPLSYGDSYGGALVAGIVGCALVLIVLLLFLRLSKVRKQRH